MCREHPRTKQCLLTVAQQQKHTLRVGHGRDRVYDFTVKYKTEVCKNWLQGVCPYAEKCAFAHGMQELRSKSDVLINYKTKLCKHYFDHGICLYGPRCHFSHEASLPSAESSAKSKLASRNTNLGRRLPVFVQLERGVKLSPTI